MSTAAEVLPDWGRLAGVEDVVEATLLRFEVVGRLLPGATQAVAGKVKALCANAGVGREPDVVRHVHKLIEGEAGGSFEFEGRATTTAATPAHPLLRPYLDPGFKHDKKEHFSRFAIRLFSDRIADPDSTYTSWVSELAGRSPGDVLREVAVRTTMREHNAHLVRTAQVAKPDHLLRLEGVLAGRFPEVPAHRRPEVAEFLHRTWPSLQREPEHQVVRKVAGALTAPITARKYTADGSPIGGKDPRLNEPTPRTEPDPDRGSFPRM